MEFPKRIYVGLSEDSNNETYFDAQKSVLDIDTDDDDHKGVAIYQLVQAGRVATTKKFIPAK